MKNAVKDAESQAEYNKFKQVAATSGKEYKARHILVEKEDDAKKIIDELKKGEKLETSPRIQGPGIGRQWRRPRLELRLHLREGIHDAMVELNKGQLSPRRSSRSSAAT